MKIILFCVGVAICLPFGECQAQTAVTACPPLMDQAAPLAPVGSRWVGMTYKGNGESRPESIMVFDGHPSELVSLQPDQSKQTTGELTSTWHFDAPTPGRGFWLACTYSNSSGIFALPLAPNSRQCRMTQRVTSSGRVAEMTSFKCY